MPLEKEDGAKVLQLITSRYNAREWRKKIEKTLSLPPSGLKDEDQRKAFLYLKVGLQAYKSRRADPPSWIVGGFATKEVIDRALFKPTVIDPSFTKDQVTGLFGEDPGSEVNEAWWEDMLVNWFEEPEEEVEDDTDGESSEDSESSAEVEEASGSTEIRLTLKKPPPKLFSVRLLSGLLCLFSKVMAWRDIILYRLIRLFRLHRCQFQAHTQGFVHTSLHQLNSWVCRLMYGVTVAWPCPVPPQGPALIVCDHTSMGDPLVLLATAGRPIRFLMAKEIYAQSHLRWVFQAFRCIPVQRGKRDIRAIRTMLDGLAAQEVIGLFPEGGLDRHRLDAGHLGIGYLAIKSGAPVIPASIVWDGPHSVTSMLKTLLVPSKARIRVWETPAIPTGGSSEEGIPSIVYEGNYEAD